MLAHPEASGKAFHVAVDANEYSISRKSGRTNEFIYSLFGKYVTMIDNFVTLLDKHFAYRIGHACIKKHTKPWAFRYHAAVS
jgi:hypothetical protein